jgi:hypothetical protein
MFNKSFSYILPLFIEKYKQYIENIYVFLENIENTYIKYDKKELFVIIVNKSEKILNDIDNLNKNVILAEFFDIKNKLILVFKIPEEFKLDYDKFIDGKYSEFSEQSKKIIIKTAFNYFPSDVFNNITKILYKSDNLKKQILYDLGISNLDYDFELTSKIDVKKETFLTEKFCNDKVN